MTPDRTEYYKKLLDELAAEIRSDLEEKGEDTAPVALDTSIGRLSRMDAMQSQQMALELKRRQQNRLIRIQTALDAIRDGRYGQCRKCGAAISEERLEVQPDALMCITCASKPNR